MCCHNEPASLRRLKEFMLRRRGKFKAYKVVRRPYYYNISEGEEWVGVYQTHWRYRLGKQEQLHATHYDSDYPYGYHCYLRYSGWKPNFNERVIAVWIDPKDLIAFDGQQEIVALNMEIRSFDQCKQNSKSSRASIFLESQSK